MSKTSAIRLIKSLSGSEKRFFKLYVKRQSVSRIYLNLFNIIDETKNATSDKIETAFKKKHPSASVHNTARYLVRILTDCLIQLKSDKDSTFELYHGLMRIKVLQERSLNEESYDEIQKLRNSANSYQQPIIEYLTYREELNYLSNVRFSSITDKRLVEMQMTAKHLLREVNTIQDHYSLFELLKYRVAHAGKISSRQQIEKLNDLVLSEMGLLANKTGHSFAVKKLHLLFQSFYFINTGDYKSALKTLSSLNQLFEANLALLSNPPFDYLSALNGMLDCLHMLGYFDQIDFYKEKTDQLNNAKYPEYFRRQVQKTSALYHLILLNSKGKYTEGIEYINSFGKDWIVEYNLIDEEKQWELFFYTAKSFFEIKNFKKAHQWINDIMIQQQIHKHLLICKATRLLDIIIYYERGETDYLEFEIKAYKKFFEKGSLLKLELLLFKYIDIYLRIKSTKKLQAKYILNELNEIQKDPFEKQLLKYFDFTGWLTSKINTSI